jgi:hypothetical protein
VPLSGSEFVTRTIIKIAGQKKDISDKNEISDKERYQ